MWDAVPYDKLPEVLRDFDVCLIPFDASTDLIKATNPVKFYEYLSAGKKVVATEIPELMPYDGKYVYCENDDAAFVEKVRACSCAKRMVWQAKNSVKLLPVRMTGRQECASWKN